MNTFRNHISHMAGMELIRDGSTLGIQQVHPGSPRVTLGGKDGLNKAFDVPVSDDLFSKHLLFLGNIGTGKTTAISKVISQIKQQMTEDDVMIIFDTKGDYYNYFYQEGDVVICNNNTNFKGADNYWNIFREITIDRTERSIQENAIEVANNLFADTIKKTNQPFFPQAAKDILATFITICASDESAYEDNDNEAMINFLMKNPKETIAEYFKDNEEYRIASYLPAEASAQADGVLSELYQLLRDVFVGDFNKKGTLSIRELVRRKGGRTIFVEYDITIGSVLAPVYRLLFDLAIKEAMGKNRSAGNVWFIIDEFRLIPNLQHLDNGINFGRSQGLKFMLGLQNIPQVYKEYGEATAESLLSGLSTVISFRLDDKKSRDFVQNRYGQALKKLVYRKEGVVTMGQIAEEIRQMKVIEDWEISSLGVGEAIIGIPNINPFVFRFGQ